MGKESRDRSRKEWLRIVTTESFMSALESVVTRILIFISRLDTVTFFFSFYLLNTKKENTTTSCGR